MDKKILRGVRADLKTIKPVKPAVYHRQEVYLGRRARVIHRIAQGIRRPHPVNCNCPFHRGHHGKTPITKGIGRRRIGRRHI